LYAAEVCFNRTNGGLIQCGIERHESCELTNKGYARMRGAPSFVRSLAPLHPSQQGDYLAVGVLRANEQSTPRLSMRGLCSFAREELSSLVRKLEQNPPASAPAVMTLAELDKAVKAIGGRLVRQDNGCIVDAPAGTVTPAIERALKAHQDELMALFPAPLPKPDRYPNAEAVINATYARGTPICKDDNGKCTLSLPSPDPELEEAFTRHYGEICKNVQSEKAFLAEMEQIRILGMGA
jgi:hypothetical protein